MPGCYFLAAVLSLGTLQEHAQSIDIIVATVNYSIEQILILKSLNRNSKDDRIQMWYYNVIRILNLNVTIIRMIKYKYGV